MINFANDATLKTASEKVIAELKKLHGDAKTSDAVKQGLATFIDNLKEGKVDKKHLSMIAEVAQGPEFVETQRFIAKAKEMKPKSFLARLFGR